MRRVPMFLLITALIAAATVPSLAQSPLGIGSAEPSISPSGPFAGWLQEINQRQREYFELMRHSLVGMRDDGGQTWTLVGLSFLYGIFHAAGPGHGKVVISSYMLANEVALRRGILLSFVSAFLQGLSAILMIGLAYLILRGSTVRVSDVEEALAIASYAMIAAFGGWLLLRKLAPAAKRVLAPRRRLAMADGGVHALFDDTTVDWRSDSGLGETIERRRHSLTGHCVACGGSHAPDAAMLSQEHFDLRSAWAAVIAVGIRPCSGALIVLTFALLNGLYLGGLLSVFAMALGTAITVSILAILAVTAKDVALRLSGDGSFGARLHFAIEIIGAVALLMIGLTLFAASLAG